MGDLVGTVMVTAVSAITSASGKAILIASVVGIATFRVVVLYRRAMERRRMDAARATTRKEDHDADRR